MTVKPKHSEKFTFFGLCSGGVFQRSDGCFFMKIPCVDYTPIGTGTILTANAVNIETGELFYCRNDEIVIPLKGSFVEE